MTQTGRLAVTGRSEVKVHATLPRRSLPLGESPTGWGGADGLLPAMSWSLPAGVEAQNSLPMGQSSVVPLQLLERVLLARAQERQGGPRASCILLVSQPSRSRCNLGRADLQPI